MGIDWKCLWMGWVAVAVGWYGDAGGRHRSGSLDVGRATLSQPLTPAIIHEGQLTLAKACVSVGS